MGSQPQVLQGGKYKFIKFLEKIKYDYTVSLPLDKVILIYCFLTTF